MLPLTQSPRMVLIYFMAGVSNFLLTFKRLMQLQNPQNQFCLSVRRHLNVRNGVVAVEINLLCMIRMLLAIDWLITMSDYSSNYMREFFHASQKKYNVKEEEFVNGN